MEYQKPSVEIIDKELVEKVLIMDDVGCHCTAGGSRVCYNAGSNPDVTF